MCADAPCAELTKRAFEMNVLQYPSCDGHLRLKARVVVRFSAVKTKKALSLGYSFCGD